MTVQIALPLSDDAAKACVVAADALSVEPWEIAVHALWMRDNYARLFGETSVPGTTATEES